MGAADWAGKVILVFVAVMFAMLDRSMLKPTDYQKDDALNVGMSPITTLKGGRAPDHIRKIHMGLDRNSVTWSGIWLFSVALAYKRNALYLLLPAVTLVFDDLCFGIGGFSMFDTEIAVQRGYEFPDIVLDHTSGHGFDYGFNLYNGSLSKTLAQAQIDKWDHMLSELQLKAGDRLLDVGCGYGDWLAYAKSKGVLVTGINISPDQANYASVVYGLEIVNTNWKDFLTNSSLQRDYYGKFDAVTFMDTVEHYISNVHVADAKPDETDCEQKHQTYYDMFEFASNMIDKKSLRKRVFISMLHTTELARELPFPLSLYIVILTRFHSGHYPPAYKCHCIMGECKPDVNEAPGQMHGLAKYSVRHFNLTRIDDVTEDYRMTAVKSPKHFQSPQVEWTWPKLGRLALMSIQDPFLLYKLLSFRWDVWMRMYGENYTSATYDPEYRRSVTYQLCYWMTFEMK